MGITLLNNTRLELAGLDIGSSSVKLVQVKKTPDGYMLQNAFCQDYAPDPDAQVHRQNRAKAIAQCMKASGLRKPSVVCGVSGPDVLIRGFRFGPLPPEALDQAVHYEARQICPMDLNTSVLDYQLVAADGKHADRHDTTGVMVIASQQSVQDRVSAVEAAGGRAVLADAEAMALLNCLNGLNLITDSQTVGIVQIGYRHAALVIYGLDGVPFVRDLNIAGKAIAEQICKETQKPAASLESLLRQPDAATMLAMNNAVVPLVDMINETLRYYGMERKTRVEHIYLCGGPVRSRHFCEMLTDALPVSARVLNPFEKMWRDLDEQSTLDLGPVMAVAAGLAMRTL